VATARVFSAENAEQRAHFFDFHGLQGHRLPLDLQLPYIATSWMLDLMHFGVHPAFVIALFDTVHLLKNGGEFIDLQELAPRIDSDFALTSLYVMLSYLQRHNLCRIANLSLMGDRHRLVGPLTLQAIHMMLDRYLVGGRSWNHVLPPPVPGRYSVANQLRKRWMRFQERWR